MNEPFLASTNETVKLIARSSVGYSIDFENLFDSLAKPYRICIFLLLALVLFGIMGAAAFDYMSPNLTYIAQESGLSQSVMGVTVMAFGNGSVDVFSAIVASQQGNDGAMALGEIMGGAFFVISIVLGSMTLVRPFQVDKRLFLRDSAVLTIAVATVTYIALDGEITLIEALFVLFLYCLYAIMVVFHHFKCTRDVEANLNGTNSGENSDEQQSMSTYDGESVSEQNNEPVMAPIRPSILRAIDLNWRVNHPGTAGSFDQSVDFYRNGNYPRQNTSTSSLLAPPPTPAIIVSPINEDFNPLATVPLSAPSPFVSTYTSTPSTPLLSSIKPATTRSSTHSINSTQSVQSPPQVPPVPQAPTQFRPARPFKQTNHSIPSLSIDVPTTPPPSSPIKGRSPSTPAVLESPIMPQIAVPMPTYRSGRSLSVDSFASMKSHESQSFTIEDLVSSALLDSFDQSAFSHVISHDEDSNRIDFHNMKVKELLYWICVPGHHTFSESSWFLITKNYLVAPFLLPLSLSIPILTFSKSRICLGIYSVMMPFILPILVDPIPYNWITVIVQSIVSSSLLYWYVYKRHLPSRFLVAATGFGMSLSWVIFLATELVKILLVLSQLCDISESFMGLTIFALGDSLGDFISNLTVAKIGFSAMAISACFGGPIFTLLIGMSSSSIIAMISSHSTVLKINMSMNIVISAAGIILTLWLTVLMLHFNKWVLNKVMGTTMITIWFLNLIICTKFFK